MLSAEQNREITQVDRGTPAGRLFRSYWLPVAVSIQLERRNPMPIEILGEKLVLFRYGDRKLGLTGDTDFDAQHDKSKWPALKDKLTAIFLTQPRDHWTALMEGSDVCFGPILSMAEALEHPHNVERGTFVTINGVDQPAPAPRFMRSRSCGVSAFNLRASDAGWNSSATTPQPYSVTMRAISGDGPIASANRAWINSKNLCVPLSTKNQ